jgi:hypothetical protein
MDNSSYPLTRRVASPTHSGTRCRNSVVGSIKPHMLVAYQKGLTRIKSFRGSSADTDCDAAVTGLITGLLRMVVNKGRQWVRG